MTAIPDVGGVNAGPGAFADVHEARPAMSSSARINAQISAGTAEVLTLEQVCERARGGLPSGVDLVTLAFPVAISGSAAVFVVPIAGRGVFTRAEHISINGIPGHPGPAPNERLGVVDTLIFADERRLDDGNYDGASLFLELLQGRVVEAECHSVEGTTHRNAFALKAVDFARFYVYNASLPAGAASIRYLRDALVPGTRIVLNGSQGIVVGPGTRDRPDAMALSITADMQDMDADLMSSEGGRPRHVVACALPVRDAATIARLVEWTGSAAGEALSCPAALRAATGLQQLIQKGQFQLSETGPIDAKPAET